MSVFKQLAAKSIRTRIAAASAGGVRRGGGRLSRWATLTFHNPQFLDECPPLKIKGMSVQRNLIGRIAKVIPVRRLDDILRAVVYHPSVVFTRPKNTVAKSAATPTHGRSQPLAQAVLSTILYKHNPRPAAYSLPHGREVAGRREDSARKILY